MIQKLNQSHFEAEALSGSKVQQGRESNSIELVDGNIRDLSQLSVDELAQLQWEQETAFAELIKISAKGSNERAEITGKAYETVCQILATASEKRGEADFVMGMDQRYGKFVLDQLASLKKNEIEGGLFELGFGSGILLDAASSAGFRVGGLEVAEQLYQEAKQRLPEKYHGNLCFGNFLQNDRVESLLGQFSLVYWNDVFEHIHVDEIEEYLARIYELLVPGGQLITITPNWHMRPMDVTASHLPPRSTAIGFHLREYTLSEVCQLLSNTGFASVKTPCFVGKKKIYQINWPDMTWFKRLVEPALEWIPYSSAVQCCRRFGLCCTIATKPTHPLP